MKKWFNLILLPLLIALTFYLLFRGRDIREIASILQSLSYRYIIFAIVSMAIYLSLEAIMLDRLINVKGRIRPPWEAIKSTFIGQFYSLITPFASGGQPMQLLSMVRGGIKASHATAVLINKFLYFQVGVTLYSLILFIFNWRTLLVYFTATRGLIALGIVFNTIGLAIIIVTIFRPLLIKNIIYLITRIMKKLNLKAERIGRFEAKWLREVDEFASSVQMILVNKGIIVKLTLMTIIQLTAYFGITYFVYLSFGHSSKGIIEILALQSVLYMSISLIPAPGSAGVAEGGFFMVFSKLFPSGQISSAVLVWRGITYYLNLLISGIITVSNTALRTVKPDIDLEEDPY